MARKWVNDEMDAVHLLSMSSFRPHLKPFTLDHLQVWLRSVIFVVFSPNNLYIYLGGFLYSGSWPNGQCSVKCCRVPAGQVQIKEDAKNAKAVEGHKQVYLF